MNTDTSNQANGSKSATRIIAPSQGSSQADEIKRLQAELAQTKAALEAASKPRSLTIKVSEKGALSVYGLNVRFPVTLYAGQWERLIAFAPEIQAFMKANADKLARKDNGQDKGSK